MASPSTTHVIEIETGIGEPAFIPLTLGHELQPISVGKKGMWRIESPRVMDVHAFVYFDGTSLFLQSADEAASATVDGYKVGKAWTELHAPCKIEIGTARLRFRSLLPDGDTASTVVKQAPPVHAPSGPGGGGAGPPSAPPPPRSGGARRRSMPEVPAEGAPPPPSLTFPKQDRPFRPGEFSAPADDESTRVAPVGEGATGTRVGTSAAKLRAAATRAAGEDDISTRPDAAQAMARSPGGAAVPPMVQLNEHTQQRMDPPASMLLSEQTQLTPHGMQPSMQSLPPTIPPPGPPATGSGPYAPIGAGPMQGAMQGGMMQGMPPGIAPPMPMMQGGPPQGYPGQPPMGPSGPYPQGHVGYPPNPGSGPYPMGPSMPPGGYGSMTPQGGNPQPQGAKRALLEMVAKYKEMSIPKRIAVILLPISMGLALWTYWDDDEPQQAPKKTRRADAGIAAAGDAGAVAATATLVPPVATPQVAPTVGPGAWPANVPCPPPGWPPNVPLPCVPNGLSNDPPAVATQTATGKDGGAKDHGRDREAGVAQPPGAKTLERQAVDAVAAGNIAQAAGLYEELSRRDPNNRVYAEAARILRAKLDGGAP